MADKEHAILELSQLPYLKLPNVNRVEVINVSNTTIGNWEPTDNVKISIQDQGRTLKIWVNDVSATDCKFPNDSFL